MKISNLYFKDVQPIEYLNNCKDRNGRLIKQVLKNNSYLLKKNNTPQCLQIQRLRSQGVRISASGIRKYKMGLYKTCALSYLQIFALYWRIDLPELMSRDFEQDSV